jgi:hypothetical protein
MSEPRCPPPLLLERALAGELTKRERLAWSKHLSECAVCKAKLAEMSRVGAEFMAGSAARVIAERLGAAEPASRATSGVRRLRGAALALAAIVLAGIVGGLVRSVLSTGPDLVPKGTGVLALWVEQTGGRAGPWDGRSAIAAGARVELTWSSAAAGHLLVVGVERSGERSVLFPKGGSRAAEVPAGARQRLGFSLVFGPSLEGARLSAFFSSASFTIDEAREVASEIVLPSVAVLVPVPVSDSDGGD